MWAPTYVGHGCNVGAYVRRPCLNCPSGRARSRRGNYRCRNTVGWADGEYVFFRPFWPYAWCKQAGVFARELSLFVGAGCRFVCCWPGGGGTEGATRRGKNVDLYYYHWMAKTSLSNSRITQTEPDLGPAGSGGCTERECSLKQTGRSFLVNQPIIITHTLTTGVGHERAVFPHFSPRTERWSAAGCECAVARSRSFLSISIVGQRFHYCCTNGLEQALVPAAMGRARSTLLTTSDHGIHSVTFMYRAALFRGFIFQTGGKNCGGAKQERRGVPTVQHHIVVP